MLTKRIYEFILALTLGTLIFSCERVSPDDPGDPGEEIVGDEGMISITLRLNKAGKTRAETPWDPVYLSFKEEDKVKDVRIILYDMQGNALYVEDFDNDNPSHWAMNGSSSLYQTKAFKVATRKYQLAVLVNFKNEWYNFAGDRDNDATDIDRRTREVGHHVSVLTDTPLDFSVNANGSAGEPEYWKAKSFLMQTLIGYDNTIPDDWNQWEDHASFFMSNADGLVEVKPSQVFPTDTEAESSPIQVRVERAVGKVLFFVAEDIEMPPYIIPKSIIPTRAAHTRASSRQLSGTWRMDTYNMKVYPMRKQALQAPYGASGAGQMEKPATPQADRYAYDPNYTTASPSDFFYLPASENNINPQDPLHNEYYMINRLWTKVEVKTDDYMEYNKFGNIEFVPENTMAPEHYHEAYASHILLWLNLELSFAFTPPGEQQIYPGTSSDFYVYNNKAYPFALMEHFLWGDPDPMDAKFYLLNGLGEYIEITTDELDAAGFTAEQKQEMFSKFVDNGEPGELYGLKHFTDGCFYRLPVRHFSDSQSPELNTGYGRYGVVRNNAYILTLTAIKGFGDPVPPEKKKIEESENTHLSVATMVVPWVYRRQEKELGEDEREQGGAVN